MFATFIPMTTCALPDAGAAIVPTVARELVTGCLRLVNSDIIYPSAIAITIGADAAEDADVAASPAEVAAAVA